MISFDLLRLIWILNGAQTYIYLGMDSNHSYDFDADVFGVILDMVVYEDAIAPHRYFLIVTDRRITEVV